MIDRVGRRALYVDTSAILGDLEHEKDTFKDFFRTTTGYRFVTSTYVVTETVRRIMKPQGSPHRFRGPNGERLKVLSRYVVNSWLQDHDVYEICLPADEFVTAKGTFETKHFVPCDLTDIISFNIVVGLEQRQILTSDREHFQQLGLIPLP